MRALTTLLFCSAVAAQAPTGGAPAPTGGAQAPAGAAPPPADANAASAATEPAADVVDDEALLARIEAACERLRVGGELRSVAALRDGAAGRRCALPTVPPRTTPLPPPQLREAVLGSTCIVGHYYRCDSCDGWHFTASTGFAVARDGVVATCWHLLEDDGPPALPSLPSLLAVADWQGRVAAVTAVLAADPDRDVAVLRCTATDLQPLPLRTARTGERVWCLSNPDHMFATFSEGLLARRYVVRGPAPGTGAPAGPDATRPAAGAAHAPVPLPVGPGREFLQVTCDFGAGSSGAPIVDQCGNLVGIAQSTATVVADPTAAVAETQMVARTAVPADALAALLRAAAAVRSR